MPAEPAEVKVDIGAYGLKALEVNGEDWTDRAQQLQITVGRDSVPQVNVAVLPKPFVYDGPGVVVIEVPSFGNPAEIIDNFLANISAENLDRIALQNLSMGESGTQAILNTLRGLLKEALEDVER